VKNLRALETMELKMIALSEQAMVNLISNRLDVETREAYEIQLKADILPKWDGMLQFLQQRCHTVKSIERRNNGAPMKVTSSLPKSSYRKNKKTTICGHLRCWSNIDQMSEKAHYINQCCKFLALTNEVRWAHVTLKLLHNLSNTPKNLSKPSWNVP
jgi:hypothetical protein